MIAGLIAAAPPQETAQPAKGAVTKEKPAQFIDLWEAGMADASAAVADARDQLKTEIRSPNFDSPPPMPKLFADFLLHPDGALEFTSTSGDKSYLVAADTYAQSMLTKRFPIEGMMHQPPQPENVPDGVSVVSVSFGRDYDEYSKISGFPADILNTAMVAEVHYFQRDGGNCGYATETGVRYVDAAAADNPFLRRMFAAMDKVSDARAETAPAICSLYFKTAGGIIGQGYTLTGLWLGDDMYRKTYTSLRQLDLAQFDAIVARNAGK